MIWLFGVASAATVAVIDFDGYGVSFEDAQTATQGVRDAFLEGGALDPLSGSDIADGVAKGADADLRHARELVAEARGRYRSGDASGALTLLTEALEMHRRALSDVGRRPELADAHYLLGLCLIKVGRASDARAHMVEATWLFPRYAKDRASDVPAAAAEMLAAAEAARTPRRARTTDQVATIAAGLAVDFVVTGSIEADGRVRTRLYAAERLVDEATATLSELPVLPIDDAYGVIARELAGAVGAAPEPVLGPVPAAAAISEEEAEDLDREASGDPAPPTVVAEESGPRTGKTRIRDAGAMRYDHPVTETWWFWTAVVVVASGGGAALGVALYEPPVETVVVPDTWSVSVAVP